MTAPIAAFASVSAGQPGLVTAMIGNAGEAAAKMPVLQALASRMAW